MEKTALNVLALDTSALSSASIGACFAGGRCAELQFRAEKSQEEKLLLSVSKLLEILGEKPENIEIFGAGVGPGSFTGLRIGIATVKGLAFALGKPVVPVSSLEALARSASMALPDPETLVVPVADARMGRVYAAIFLGRERLMEDRDILPEELKDILEKRPEKRILFAGDGLNLYGSVLSAVEGKTVTLDADRMIAGLALLELVREKADAGLAVTAADLDAVYLRKSEPESKWDAAHAVNQPAQ